MKKDKKAERKHEVHKPSRSASARQHHWRLLTLGVIAGIIAVVWAYLPALHGPFLFDDQSLKIDVINSATPFRTILHSPRPLLLATYWLSGYLSEPDDTLWFHIVNVIIHVITSGLIFLSIRRLLEWLPENLRVDAGTRNMLAGFGAAIFLLHPVQTEAVAYLAGRSESFSDGLAFAAFTVFLYRGRTEATWHASLIVLALFGAAILSKEQTIALPALFLLTDYWWNPGFSLQGIWKNWRLYVLMALCGMAGLWLFRALITSASTAGFGMKDFTWYQYFFTQCRALFVYIGLFLFPARLNADWDFAISKTILDKGAIIGMLALIALAAAAWKWRRRFPLASYGYFAFLLLMAPTSSILPIQDPIAERRLYFGILGLILIVLEGVMRIKMERKALVIAAVAVLAALTAATHARAEVWSDTMKFWEDAVNKSPNKWRPHSQLAYAHFLIGKQDPGLSGTECRAALEEYKKAAWLHPQDAGVFVDWGLAYDCLDQLDEALVKMQQALQMRPDAHIYSQIGMLYGKKQMWDEALLNLKKAEGFDKDYPDIYIYRGIAYTQMGRLQDAVQEFLHALRIDPGNGEARRDLQAVSEMIRKGTGK